jgi:FkbM family methyltransferase
MSEITRRAFFPTVTTGISGGFLLGAIGGAASGAAGAVAGMKEGTRPWAKLSHSQQGEDLVAMCICESLEILNPTYLDIGAADPIVLSNTYLFYERGCRGVLVEPNPKFCRKLEAARPGDKVLNVGVGFDDRDSADYYMVGGPDGEYLNTFSAEEAEVIRTKAKDARPIVNVIKMPLVNINKLIEENLHRAPDFLSTDTEGLDLAILKSLDFDRFRPKIICVETLILGTNRAETAILDLMASKNYTVRGGTFVNTIFVDNQLLV